MIAEPIVISGNTHTDQRVLHIRGRQQMDLKRWRQTQKVIIYSDFTVPKSVKNDCRFDLNKWFDWGKDRVR